MQRNRSNRSRSGSVVLDRRIKTWNFFYWDKGKRRSKKIGTVSQYPTKASAWRAARALHHSLENELAVPANTAPKVSTLVAQYMTEKLPQRINTKRTYLIWLKHYIVPKWGTCSLSDLQARPVELWIGSLELAPKSKAHVRGMLRTLWEYAMWSGTIPVQRNPMELVTVKGASKRLKKPRCLTVAEFQNFVAHLSEPFRTMGYCQFVSV